MDPWLYLICGLVLLLAGAETLIRGAGQLAMLLGMPRVLVALTVVAFGSSTPELVASLVAASKGEPSLALGNVLGSNLANIALVIGLAALIRPVRIHARLLRKELPLLLGLQALLFLVLLPTQAAERSGGILLVALGLIYMLWIYWVGSRNRQGAISRDFSADEFEVPARGTPRTAIFFTVIGLVLLPVGAYLLVQGALQLADRLGMSSGVVGFTIVAVGTSMPEIATTLVAVLRKEFGVAAGTVMGSNVFNICFVLGITSTVFPFEIPAAEVAEVNLSLVMTGILTVLLTVFSYIGKVIGRFEGAVLLTIYAGYMYYLVQYPPA